MEEPTAHRPVLVQEVVALLEPSSRKVLVDCTVGRGARRGAADGGGQAGAAHRHGRGRDEPPGRPAASPAVRPAFSPFPRQFRRRRRRARRCGVFRRPMRSWPTWAWRATSWTIPARGFSFAVGGPAGHAAGPLRTADGGGPSQHAGRGRAGGPDLPVWRGALQPADCPRDRGAPPGEAASSERRNWRPSLPGPTRRTARRSRRGVHPATRTFQALRIAVNEELDRLDGLLAALPSVLAAGRGRRLSAFTRWKTAGSSSPSPPWPERGVAES